MNNDDLMRWARKAGFDVHQSTVYATGECSQELERFAALVRADEREKHQENNLMAECMDMVRDDLIRAGIISEDVPPMMLPEAIKRALKERVEAEREKCAQVCDRRVMGDNNREDSEARRCADAIRARAKGLNSE